jgi:hypothetical protein
MEILTIVISINTILNVFYLFILTDIQRRLAKMESIHLTNNNSK